MAGAERQIRDAAKRAERRSSGLLWAGVIAGGLIAIGILVAPGLRNEPEETVSPVELDAAEVSTAPVRPKVEPLGVRVIRKYPHATDAFTQGLIWHDGVMYESTGQYGKSDLRRVRLKDGEVLAKRKLDPRVFGEGLALVDRRLVQLTWRSGIAFVSDIATLQERETLRYAGEGWGLCYDGKSLVMSNGSSTLDFRDPESMALLRKLSVTKDGRPVDEINELECVGKEIYANVWRHDEILRIDSTTGRVTGSIDAGGLLTRAESWRADVLNGIAYKPDSKTFLLTGKLWPQVFEVDFVPR
jgi:glutaminyl-peptide cyclotransferase